MSKRGPKGNTPAQIVQVLRQIELALGQGQTVKEAVIPHDITENTYYRWKREYGQMGADEVRRLKALEKENARLKKLVAELTLDKDILKEALEGKF